jgi:Cu2+-containing amine oxidase
MATMNTPLSVKPTTILHPLASLQPDEVIRARDIVSQYNAGKDILWKIISVKEPPKAQVITYCPTRPSLL